MTLERTKEIFEDYKNAVGRLKEAVKEKSSINSLAVDGTIQRFEFTFELAWKVAKNILDCSGITTLAIPRSVIKEAFRAGIIKGGQEWIEMLENRNKTSHIYDEKQALEIYNKIKGRYFELFDKFVSEAANAINDIKE